MSLDFRINEEIDIKSEPFDTEIDGNQTFGQNTTVSGNEMDTDNIEISVEDVKPFHLVEVLLAESSVTDNCLQCGKCNEKFSSHENLQQHLINFHGKDIKCSICNETFTRHTFKSHLSTHAESKPFKCPVCSSQFTHKSHLKRHLITKHNLDENSVASLLQSSSIDTHKCEACQQSFKTKQGLERHIYSRNKEVRFFNCTVCTEVFAKKCQLNIHLSSQHVCKIQDTLQNSEGSFLPLKPYKCEICHLKFTAKASLDNHIQSLHKGIKSFKCNTCGACFSKRFDLNSHSSIHSGEKLFKCSLCSKSFRIKRGLKDHLIRVHKLTATDDLVQNIKQPTVPVREHMVCEKCNVQFSSHENLSQHVCTIQDNVKIEPFEEHDTEFDSNETFGQNTTLSGNEMDTDNIEIGVEDVKPFEFVEVKTESLLAEPDNSLTCGKSNAIFENQPILNSRLRNHACPECSLKFMFKCHLKQHMVQAHNLDENSIADLMPPPNSHKCETCHLSFTVKASLKQHIQSVHQGLKPYKCNVCKACFTKKDNLTSHLSIHSGKNQLKCSICNQDFRWRKSLQRHLINIHKPTATNNFLKNNQSIIIDQKTLTFCKKCNVQFSSHENLSQHVCIIQDNVKIEPFEEHDTEFDSNETFGQNTTLSGNEMDTDNIEIGVEDVKPFDIVEMENKSLLAEPVTDNSLTCGKCSEEFSSFENLQQHNLTSHDCAYKCSICNKPFKSQSNLKSHIRRTHTEHTFTCPECSFKFKLRTHLKRHLITIHKLNENSAAGLMPPLKSHECETCHLSFTKKGSLVQHIKSQHKGLKRFKCNVCGTCFSKKCHLNFHSTIHSGEKPYKCSICSEDFRSRNGIKWHLINVHKKFMTSEFVQRKKPTLSIIIDQKTHAMCEICNEEFSSHEILKLHKLTFHDSGFKCSICDATFTRKTSLNAHLKIHARIKRFTCPKCGREFLKLCNYRCHLLLKHKLDENSVASLLPPSKKKKDTLQNFEPNRLQQSRATARQPDCKSTASSLPEIRITKVKPCCVMLDRGEVTRYLSRLDKREVTEERGSPIEGLPPPLATPAPPVRDDPRHPCGAVSVTSDLLLGAATSTLENVRQEENLETNYLLDSCILNSDDDKLSLNHSSKYCNESENLESEQLENFEEMYIKTEPIDGEISDIPFS